MTTTLLDRAAAADPAPAQRLRLTTAAVRVTLRWLGVRKTLTPEQKTQAAESFGAEGDFLSARKKLLDTRHPAFQAVTAVRGRVLAYWKGMTLPYPEPGIRLIRQDKIDEFNRRLTELRGELEEAVARLDDHYAELQAAAQRRLGDLYSASDYPPSVAGLFGIDWDFPNVEPPDYLLQLHPRLYEEERARVAGRFEEAVRLAEQAFTAELGKLVAHLAERLSAGPDGSRKVFRDSAVTNLVEFFDRFGQLNVRSNAQLDGLVEQARGLVQGVEAQALREDASLRQQVAQQLAGVQATLDDLLVDQPRRRIVRSVPSSNGVSHAPLD
jgi:hypothetical protein